MHLVKSRVLAALVAAPLMLLFGAPAIAQVVQVGETVVETVATPEPLPRPLDGTAPVWSHTFRKAGASYIAVHFSEFRLADGDRLVLSDPEGRYRHTYTGLGLNDRGGKFWGLSVFGDTMNVTLYASSVGGAGDEGVTIDRWAHGFPTDPGKPPETDALCGSEDFRDIECYRDTYPQAYEKGRAAVRLLKNGSAHCTGWLASCENHIITNEHCVGSQGELDQIEFQFEFKRSECGGGSTGAELQLQGGTLLDFNSGLDYALIMPDLAGNDPQATYGYMQIETRLPDVGELMYIPGHPSGDPKRLSIESTSPNDPTGRCEVHSVSEPACTGGPVPDVGYYCDTEGGSSGSAVLSAETHRVIALHHCANCPNRGVPIVDVYNSIQASPNPLPACSTCIPGDVPQDLVASSPGDNRIFLDWQESANTVRYHVYRSTQGCESGMEEIGTSTEPTYLDESVAGGITYYYRVTAESECGAESAVSNCAEATPSGICTEPPRFDGALTAASANESGCGIDVSWEEATARCGSVRYNVYRSTFEGFEPGPGNLVASCLNSTSWRDTDVLSRQPYHYIVRAEDDAEQGGGPCSGGNQETNLVVRSTEARGPDDVVYHAGFDGQEPPWLLNGEWQSGVPQGKGGSAGGGVGSPDPLGTPFGLGALGLDISGQGAYPGNYEKNLDDLYTLSPSIDVTGHDELRLRFHRWLSVNASDSALVQVCDGPSECTAIWESPDFDVRDADWESFDADVSDELVGVSDARIRFSLSSDGGSVAAGWTIDEVEIYAPTSCASDAVGLPPVPDGAFAPGQAMTATRSSGTLVDLSWDVSRCTSPDYHVYHGTSEGLASYAYADAACNLGTSGAATVDLPDPQPGTFVWWTIVGSDGASEGIHGYTSSGAVRPATADGLCGVTTQSAASPCP